MTKPGIVLCSRVHSRRLPRKSLIEFCGKPAIRILCERLMKGPYPICLATPTDLEDNILHEVTSNMPLLRFRGHRDNVLARFYWAAAEHEFDPVIRVTHDDLFVDTEMMTDMVEAHKESNADYTFVSKCVRGADCEIVSFDFLERCYKFNQDQGNEFLSYAFRRPELKPKICEYMPSPEKQSKSRLVLDWPEDVKAISIIIDLYGTNIKNDLLCDVLNRVSAITEINKLPKISVYTCAHNAQETIGRAVASMLGQTFTDHEYIIYDDGSTDLTPSFMLDFSFANRIKLRRNQDNVGLASACNIALREARGEYILRLDADDELLPNALETLVSVIEKSPEIAAVYPAYYRNDKIEQNNDHHMGGAIMRRRIYEEVKFCDGLRHWEGQEFYQRLTKRFIATQIETPTWVYHHSENSLSNSEHEKRAKLKDLITSTSLSGESKESQACQ